jgi:flavin-binding protein dodecin
MRKARATVLEAKNAGTRAGGRRAIALASEKANVAEVAETEGHVYRVIEIVGSSERSVEEAIAAAVGRANQTIRNLRWFEVVRTSGHIEDGKVRHYQVTLKVGFTMEGAG